ncbi:RidA family protein [Nonomuraea sp. NPDC050790]|uniref:RidA family protein n=1 Tax=Nonomuraea sp. NPDC050790 TaxID=3364371 RepID=UPI00379E885E
MTPTFKEIVPVPALEDSTPFAYSQCVKVGPTLYLAGQCGLGDDHEVVSPDFADQARRALDRVRLAVEAAGGVLDDIVTMTVFLTDTRMGRVFTGLRKEYFGDRFPASALVGVSSLMPLNAMIEIQAVAVLGSGMRDSGARDSGTRDSGGRDSGTRDSGGRDSETRDSETRDSETRDLGGRESGRGDRDA